jgi:hypothetical protein
MLKRIKMSQFWLRPLSFGGIVSYQRKKSSEYNLHNISLRMGGGAKAGDRTALNDLF